MTTALDSYRNPPLVGENLIITPAIGEPQLLGENPDLTADYIFCNNLYVKNIFQQGGGGSVSFPLLAPSSTFDNIGLLLAPPPYTFQNDLGSGMYLTNLGEPGIATNSNDGSNIPYPTLQIRETVVNGYAPSQGGRMVALPIAGAFGWIYNSNVNANGQYMTQMFQDASPAIIGFACMDFLYGTNFRLYGAYDPTNFNRYSRLEIDTQSTSPGVIWITTATRGTLPGGTGRVDLFTSPAGKLGFSTGNAQPWWGMDPAISTSAWIPYGNNIADIGTPTNKVRNLYIMQVVPPVGIGQAGQDNVLLAIQGTFVTAGTTMGAMTVNPTFATNTTTRGLVIEASFTTPAGTFTIPQASMFSVQNPTLGAGTTITNLYGMIINPIGGAQRTNVYGLYLASQSGASGINESLHVEGNLTHANGTWRLNGGAGAFFGGTPQNKQTVTGSRAGNVALASVLTILNSMGLLTDSSTA